jgi:hypothetical protein
VGTVAARGVAAAEASDAEHDMRRGLGFGRVNDFCCLEEAAAVVVVVVDAAGVAFLGRGGDDAMAMDAGSSTQLDALSL